MRQGDTLLNRKGGKLKKGGVLAMARVQYAKLNPTGCGETGPQKKGQCAQPMNGNALTFSWASTIYEFLET